MALLEYYNKVDRQGRVTIPLPYRQMVGDKAMLLLAPEERYIAGRPSKMVKHSLNDDLGGHLTAGDIFEQRLDSRGRITIPAKLREHAEIESVVVISALDDYFELWSERHWEFKKTQIQTEAVSLVASQEGAYSLHSDEVPKRCQALVKPLTDF